MNFSGKVCVLTGAAGGMGRELALQLSAEGCNLALCDVREKELDETVAMCKTRIRAAYNFEARVIGHVVDVCNEQQIEDFRSIVVQTFGDTIHLLINNAGIATAGSFTEMEKERFDRTFDVSFKGTVFFTRAFLPLAINAERASIVNLSSINGIWFCLGPATWPVRTPPHAPYCAGKAAIRGFTEALMFDAAQNFPHVTVACVHPGHVGTDIATLSEVSSDAGAALDTARTRAARIGVERAESMTLEELRLAVGNRFKEMAPLSAKEAAAQILDGVKKGRTRIMVGEDAIIIDLLTRMFPRLVYNDYFITFVIMPWTFTATRIGKPFGKFLFPALLAALSLRFASRL